MKIAILGIPQSGKFTLFSLLTGRKRPEHLDPTSVIEGLARLQDSRVDDISRIIRPKKITYAEMEFTLCPSVSEGGGRRAWLEAARRSDLLCVVARSFSDDSIYHPSGSIDAHRDVSSVQTEFLLADLELVETRLTRIAKEKRAGQTTAQVLEENILNRCNEAIGEGIPLREAGFQPHEELVIRSLDLLTMKPVLGVYNCDDNGLEGDGGLRIACKTEREIMEIQDLDERKEFLSELGIGEPGIEKLNKTIFRELGLMSFYTMGETEVRAWTVRKNQLAPAVAGKIHSDMERGFIRVEVIKYADLMAAGSESVVREQGKLSLKGKDYIIEDADICLFLFNV